MELLCWTYFAANSGIENLHTTKLLSPADLSTLMEKWHKKTTKSKMVTVCLILFIVMNPRFLHGPLKSFITILILDYLSLINLLEFPFMQLDGIIRIVSLLYYGLNMDLKMLRLVIDWIG